MIFDFIIVLLAFAGMLDVGYVKSGGAGFIFLAIIFIIELVRVGFGVA